MFRLLIKALKKIHRGIYKFKECYNQSKEFSVSPVKAFRYVLKGFSVNKYYCYQLNRSNYKDYLTFQQGHLPHRVNSFGDISGDKLSFSEIFKQFVDVPVNLGYIKKGCIYALNNSGINNENFYNYVINNEVYIKPYNGSDGRGIVHLAADADRKTVFRGGVGKIDKEHFDTYIKTFDNVLIQAKLEQGSFAASLYPHTTNTLRIISVRDKSGTGHRIIAARQRIGCSVSFPIDNFDKNGLAFTVNLETGEIGKGTSKRFLNADGSRYFIEKHPDTGMQITGLFILFWSEIKKKIISITKQFPIFEFVAWDVVLKDNGDIALMEINLASGLCMFQVLGDRKESDLGKYLLDIETELKK